MGPAGRRASVLQACVCVHARQKSWRQGRALRRAECLRLPATRIFGLCESGRAPARDGPGRVVGALGWLHRICEPGRGAGDAGSFERSASMPTWQRGGWIQLAVREPRDALERAHAGSDQLRAKKERGGVADGGKRWSSGAAGCLLRTCARRTNVVKFWGKVVVLWPRLPALVLTTLSRAVGIQKPSWSRRTSPSSGRNSRSVMHHTPTDGSAEHRSAVFASAC